MSPSAPRAILGQLGPGRSLDGNVASRMSSAFGSSFSQVRVHTDARAAALSSKFSARAFTLGNHVAFGSGEYQPGTPIGDALLAHELAHVEQQKSGTETPQRAASVSGALEDDADRTAIGAMLSLLGIAKTRFRGIAVRSAPALASGLRLQRCDTKSKGPIGTTRLSQARTNFRGENDHLSSDELNKVDRALAAVTGDNLHLYISFYDYFSNHEIVKDAKVREKGLDGETKPLSDMHINPDLLGAGTTDARLGGTLLHEYSHTRHGSNPMGMGDFQEGESYAIEHFFATRKGETARAQTIESLVSTSGRLTIPNQHAAMQNLFRATYGTLIALYEVIDRKPPRPGVAHLSNDDAQRLAAELVDTKEASRGTELKAVMDWVKQNLSSFTLPI